MKLHLGLAASLVALLCVPSVVDAHSITVEVGRVAAFLNGGNALEVDVTVTCPKTRIPLEAFVYVVQNGNESEFAAIPVVCRGFARTYIVRVRAGERLFTRARAVASAFVLATIGDTEDTESGDDNRPLLIR
jgi:hypothetical protein